MSPFRAPSRPRSSCSLPGRLPAWRATQPRQSAPRYSASCTTVSKSWEPSPRSASARSAKPPDTRLESAWSRKTTSASSLVPTRGAMMPIARERTILQQSVQAARGESAAPSHKLYEHPPRWCSARRRGRRSSGPTRRLSCLGPTLRDQHGGVQQCDWPDTNQRPRHHGLQG